MRCKRFLASLLLVAALLSLTGPMAQAASSFSDINNENIALNADILRLMGVVSGSGSNQFDPGGVLTRAQFSVMVVNVMGRGAEVPRYTTQTIFSDVPSTHWARGYINLVSSTMVGAGEDKKGSALISGVGDGRFLPNDKLTYAQAVTIPMRLLGYSEGDVGAVWPQGYLNMANAIGLTDGVKLTAGASLTRAQAAQLLVNLLRSEMKDGKPYYETLGTATKNVLLLALDVRDAEDKGGAIRTSVGIYQPIVRDVSPTALQGRQGTLVIRDGKLAAFIPDNTTSVTITLAGDAQPTYIQGTNNTRYTVSSDTPVYDSNSTGESKSYAQVFADMRSGTQLTLFIDGGKVISIYNAAAGVSSTEAIVVTGPINAASFRPLTGGAKNVVAKKYNEVIKLTDIQMYDVVTYDPINNTLLVSDLRLTGVYEGAEPNLAAPETVTVLGTKFDVLPTAVDTISKFTRGQIVSILLSADGKVAAMYPATADTRSTAIGWAGDDGVEIILSNGSTMTIKVDAGENANQLVTIASTGSSGNAKATTARYSGSRPVGAFDLEKMTLGSYRVGAGVRVYETVGSSSVVPLSLSELELASIPANKLAGFHLNPSGFVDLIILNAVTGDAYSYGYFVRGEVTSGEPPLVARNTTISVRNSTGVHSQMITGEEFKEGTLGGIAPGARKISGLPVAQSIITLSSFTGVKRTDFFEQDGVWFVHANNQVYQVSSKVECRITSTDVWMGQGEEALTQMRAYSNDMTIYIDPVGHKVRFVMAQ